MNRSWLELRLSLVAHSQSKKQDRNTSPAGSVWGFHDKTWKRLVHFHWTSSFCKQFKARGFGLFLPHLEPLWRLSHSFPSAGHMHCCPVAEGGLLYCGEVLGENFSWPLSAEAAKTCACTDLQKMHSNPALVFSFQRLSCSPHCCSPACWDELLSQLLKSFKPIFTL